MNSKREQVKNDQRLIRQPLFLSIVIAASMLISSNTLVVYAGSDTVNLNATAQINAKCKFRTGGPSAQVLDFGEYDPIIIHEAVSDASSGAFDVKCTKNTTSQVGLSDGLYASFASGTTRAMSDGQGHYLSYEIYTTAGLTTVWNASNTVNYTDNGGNSTAIQVYGAIPPGQDAYVGNYSDTVVMTVTY